LDASLLAVAFFKNQAKGGTVLTGFFSARFAAGIEAAKPARPIPAGGTGQQERL